MRRLYDVSLYKKSKMSVAKSEVFVSQLANKIPTRLHRLSSVFEVQIVNATTLIIIVLGILNSSSEIWDDMVVRFQKDCLDASIQQYISWCIQKLTHISSHHPIRIIIFHHMHRLLVCYIKLRK